MINSTPEHNGQKSVHFPIFSTTSSSLPPNTNKKAKTGEVPFAEGKTTLDNNQPLAGATPATVTPKQGDAEELVVHDNGIPPRADELSEKELEEFAKRFQLMCLVRAGRSPREALKHMGIEGSDSWVRKLCRRYELRGAEGLLDWRSRNGSKRRLFTKEVEELTLALWYSRPAAGPQAIHRELKKVCAERGVPCPEYDVIKKFLKGRPLHDQWVRAGKIAVWDKQARPVVRFNITSYANERWQVDHTRLDIWVRVKEGDVWLPAEVYLSVAMDAHSRAIRHLALYKVS
jgi:hypothetical protein